MTALASTTYIRLGILVDADDNTLARISQLIIQLIFLLSLLIIFWQKIETFVYLLSDLFVAVDYTWRIMAIVVNTVRFAL